MLYSVLKKIGFGLCWGSFVLCLTLALATLFGNRQMVEIIMANFIPQFLCALLVGVGFTLPALSYDVEGWSLLRQATVHMGIGFLVFFPVAWLAGWIPRSPWAILGTVLMMFVLGLAVWACFALFHKKEADSINKALKQNKNHKSKPQLWH